MKILLIEDNENKCKAIISFLCETFKDIEVDVAKSYVSGVDIAMKNSYNLILLDMTIPTFDVSGTDTGGETLKNGGEIVVEELLDEDIEFDCAVITQYETFNNESLNTISDRLEKMCGKNYHGCIKYDSYNDKWKGLLKQLIEDVDSSNN